MSPLIPKKKGAISKEINDRIERGRERLRSVATDRDVAHEFYRGNHYAYADENNVLQVQATVTSVRGTGKPRWRARQKRNLIFDAVLYETSAATQRVPNYQVVPSTEDPEDRSAAQLAEKVAVYGHGKWGIRKAAADAVHHAVVAGEAFAWPYFDNTIGPFIDDGEGGRVGQGDVRIRIFGANECYWEPGVRFEDSPWHCVEQARPAAAVEAMDGFMLSPGTLSADADTRQIKRENKGKLVLVTDYLERPSTKNPEGTWITMANNKRIVPDRPYPCEGSEPVLRKLSYAPDPDSDRDLGLVPQLVDAMRSKNDAENKLIEWKNLCLLPRIVVTPGLMKKQRWTDEPGKVYEIPQPEQNFKVVDTPVVPRELFEIADRAAADIGRIAAQNDIPTQVESGKGVQALLEMDASRRAAFVTELAEWYSNVMHDCLYLVQRHYTEDRILHIKGDFGWESISDFQGSSLKDQIDVRVFPDSIEPRTRQAVEQRVMNFVQMGWLGPEQAMTAIESGTTDALMSRLMRDEARAHRIVQRLKAGPEALGAMPEIPTGRMVPITDEFGMPITDETGNGQTQMEMAPAWMPRHSDNLAVFRVVFEDWMKTEEFEALTPEIQEAAANVYAGILELEAQKEQEAQMAQMAQAEQMGMDNAARPQDGNKPNPSMPALPE